MKTAWGVLLLSAAVGCAHAEVQVIQPGSSDARVPATPQAELFMQLQQMQRDIAQLRGQLEEQQNAFEQMRQENQARYQALEDRLAASQPTAGAAPAPAQAPASSTVAAPVTAPAQASVPAADADPAKEKLYYEAAFDLVKKRDFPKAQQALSAFLKRYPSGAYAGNAQYWLGEVDLALGDLAAAEPAFARVVQAYPNHPKVPDALYKMADVQIRLGETANAKATLQQLVSHYPNTSAGQLAQKDLAKLP